MSAEDDPRQGVLFDVEVPQSSEVKTKKRKCKKAVSSCVVCGKPLSDPRSVAAGYGPVCMHNHYADGQQDYVENLFMLDESLTGRKIASFTVSILGENTILITDLDDDKDKPSVTNSIDEILLRLNIDKHTRKVVCLGTDGMYSLYNGTWKFVGWTEEEAIKTLKLRGAEDEISKDD
jgi:hypothetical protein